MSTYIIYSYLCNDIILIYTSLFSLHNNTNLRYLFKSKNKHDNSFLDPYFWNDLPVNICEWKRRIQ